MTTSPPAYDPPTSATMKVRQNELDALRLLIAQRRLYQRAKRWLGLRWIGIVVIGLAAPVVSVLWPSLAVASGAVAGLWLFLGRTMLPIRQTSLAGQGAAVQEQADAFIFGMSIAKRSEMPSLEAVAAIAGPDSQLQRVAEAEKLVDWYPIDENDEGATTVAIAQRANASYSDRLIGTTATTWSVLVGLWIVLLVVISALADLSWAEFLLGVAFPLLPAFLDVVQYVTGVRRSASDKAELANLIEDHLSGKRDPIKPEYLLVWQERLFDLRREAPEVPDFIYRLKRNKNERAMEDAARQLSQRAKRQKP